MFARLFRASSKDCLQSEDPLTPSQQLREESRRTRSMVTTRGRARELADTPSVNGDTVPIDEGTPVPKKRGRPRKSLPVEDDEVVGTPRPTRSSTRIQASDGEATPKQQSPQATVAEEQAEPQTIEVDEEVIKKTKINGDSTTTSKTTIITTTPVVTPVAKKHKRFDSAEPEPVPEEMPEIIDSQDDGDESSDDAPPEEVTTNEAAKSAKDKGRDAAKAIEEFVLSDSPPT